MMDKYVWDRESDTIRKVDDVLEWGTAFETADRRVAMTKITNPTEEIVVYTSFLGIDHNFWMGPDKVPLLFETMYTRNGAWGDLQIRYSTAAEARQTHDRLVEHIKAGKPIGAFEQ